MMRAVIVYDRKQEVRLNGMAPADRCSAQIRIMTGRLPTSRNTLATTFRKLSGTVRSQ